MLSLLISIVILALSSLYVYFFPLKKKHLMQYEQHKLHLHQRQLYALGALAQYALQKLLDCLSLETVRNRSLMNASPEDASLEDASPEDASLKDASEALSKIFSDQKDIVKGLSNVNNKDNRIIIYKDHENNVFHDKIDSSRFDTSALVSVLSNIKYFSVSCPSKRMEKCKNDGNENHANKCCTDCSEQKDTYRCKKKCPNKYSCCEGCNLCMNCTSEGNLHELIEKLVCEKKIDDVCQIMVLRLSIDIIRKFRNLMSHLTHTRYKDMESGNFAHHDVPSFFKSWVNLRKLFQFALDQVLDYIVLKDKDFTESNKLQIVYDAAQICETTKHADLDAHTSDIDAYLKLERIENVFDNIQKGIENIKDNVKKSLTIAYKFDLNDTNVKIHLKSEKVADIRSAIEEAMISYLGVNPDSLKANMVHANKGSYQNPQTAKIKIKIESIENKVNLKDFESSETQESEKLWKELEKEIKKVLPAGTEFELITWDIGSIIINVSIRKRSNQNWKDIELEEIEEKLPSVEKIVENNLPGTNCQCEMQERKFTGQENLGISLIFRFDILDIVARKIFNFDEGIFMTHLNRILEQQKETIIATGKKIIYVFSYFLLIRNDTGFFV